MKPDVTVILECSHEGRFVHPVLRSIELSAQGLAVEVIVVASQPSAAMREYLSQLDARQVLIDDQPKMRARNQALKQAAGEFIAIVDGNELISPNWLTSALEAACANEANVVHHPATIIGYGKERVLYFMPDQKDQEFSHELLFERNLWPGALFASAKLLLAHPFHQPDGQCGFGQPSWHWVCETVAAGVIHRRVENTFVCVQQEEQDDLLVSSTKLFQVGAK